MYPLSNSDVITLVASVLAFIASLSAVIVAAKNSRFSRFVSEKWWERTFDAYSRIIDSLSDLVYYYDQIFEFETTNTEVSKEKREEISIYWKKGNLQIKKATNIGAFMISPDAAKALQQYWRFENDYDPNDWLSRITYDYNRADKCIKELVICANKDLTIEEARRQGSKHH